LGRLLVMLVGRLCVKSEVRPQMLDLDWGGFIARLNLRERLSSGPLVSIRFPRMLIFHWRCDAAFAEVLRDGASRIPGSRDL
jgi:hypothetical protein